MTAALAIDTAELETALPCPLCRYDLRGLPPGRCPECGHGFNPAELRAAQRKAADRPIPWLVEYPAPGFVGFMRNVLVTPLMTMWPWWFWNRLRPTMRVEEERLSAYAGLIPLTLIVAALFALAIEPFVFWLEAVVYYVATLEQRIWIERIRSGWGWDWPLHARLLSMLLPLLIITVWQWLTLAILSSFRMSLRQAKIAPGHLLRCVSYSADLSVPLVIIIVLVSAMVGWSDRTGGSVEFDGFLSSLGLESWSRYAILLPPTPIVLTLAATLAWFAVRLSTAYRRYLAFPHAIATVLSSQIILWLVLLIFANLYVGEP